MVAGIASRCVYVIDSLKPPRQGNELHTGRRREASDACDRVIRFMAQQTQTVRRSWRTEFVSTPFPQPPGLDCGLCVCIGVRLLLQHDQTPVQELLVRVRLPCESASLASCSSSCGLHSCV